jgi:hypothetical protein
MSCNNIAQVDHRRFIETMTHVWPTVWALEAPSFRGKDHTLLTFPCFLTFMNFVLSQREKKALSHFSLFVLSDFPSSKLATNMQTHAGQHMNQTLFLSFCEI